MINIILSLINEIYDIKVTKIHEKVEGGYLSDNYCIGNSKKKYFLKQYGFDDEERILSVHKVKFFFSCQGVPIILPLVNKTNTIFKFENHYYAIFPYVTAHLITRDMQTEKSLISLTEMLAKIHLISKENYPKLMNTKRKIHDPEKLFIDAEIYSNIINNKPVLDDFDSAALKHMKLKKKLSQTINISYDQLCEKNDHLLHGDFHEHNVFYDGNQNVSHVFDLEKATIGSRAIELIRMIDLVVFDSHFDQVNYNYAKIVFDTYQQQYPLQTKEWKDAIKLYYYDQFSSLWILKSHYLTDNIRPDKFLISGLKGLEFHLQHFREHRDVLENFIN